MADASHEDLIAEFANVTGADPERAKFYLESSAWKLEIALASFFDNDEGGPDSPPAEMEPEPEAEPPAPTGQAAQARPKERSKFATISSMKQDEEESSEEEGQAFYAGGSDRGAGQQILGPKKNKKDADEIVKNMFKSAKEHGGEEVAAGPSSDRPSRGPTFGGAGYRLGDTEGQSDMIMGQSAQAQPKQVDTVLKLWKNGFSVDDGELRDYHDPANREFLAAIHKGEVPRELIKMAQGGEVNLNMEDHRGDEFVKPKSKIKAFSGSGQTLGSPAPSVAQPAAAASSASAAASQETAKASVDVDTSKPVTSIQIRLADGTRMVSKFNHSHTVADIRSYIIAAHPQFAGATFVLMTTFPNKELSDESQSIEDAKLLNAVIVQRMK